MTEKFLSIGEAAKLVSVSIDTLRRWDESGKLKAAKRTPGGQRLYRPHDIEVFSSNLADMALAWVSTIDTPPDLPENFYCQFSSTFQARLTSMAVLLQREPSIAEFFPLLVAITGEIGNNSFDHNIGNWPDVPGIFFGFDVQKRQIVLADRGQGILATLKRVKLGLKTHADALQVAFTEVLSGRQPEQRGNGLKFVRSVIRAHPINLLFRTGNARIDLRGKQDDLDILDGQGLMRGCLAFITF